MYVIVAGSGELGSELARTLSEHGHNVVVIDSEPAALKRLGPAFDGVTLRGTAVDSDILRQAGADRADALAAVTDSDQVNLMVAQVAREVFALRRVVARVASSHLEDIYRRMGIATLRPGKSAVAQIAGLLGSEGLSHLLALGAGEVELSAFNVAPALAGQPAERLNLPGKCRLGGLVREGRVLLPEPDLRLQPGDTALVLIRLDARSAVEAWTAAAARPGGRH